jgi:hypothetical protein
VARVWYAPQVVQPELLGVRLTELADDGRRHYTAQVIVFSEESEEEDRVEQSTEKDEFMPASSTPPDQDIAHVGDVDDAPFSGHGTSEAPAAEHTDASDDDDGNDDASWPRKGFTRRAFLFNAATASVAFAWGIGAGY